MSRPPKSKPHTAASEAAPARRATRRRKSTASARRRLAAEKALQQDVLDRDRSLEASLKATEDRVSTLERSLAEAIRQNDFLERDLARSRAETLAVMEEAELLRAVVVETAISAHVNGSSLRAAAKSRAIASSVERFEARQHDHAMVVTDGVLR